MLAQALVLVLLAIFFFRWWFLQLSKWGREARDRALQAAGIVFSIFLIFNLLLNLFIFVFGPASFNRGRYFMFISF